MLHTSPSIKHIKALLYQRGFMRYPYHDVFLLFYRHRHALPYLEKYFPLHNTKAKTPRIHAMANTSSSHLPKAHCNLASKTSTNKPQHAPIILAQSDTTAGFLSHSPYALNHIKHRLASRPLLCTFTHIKYLPHRIPHAHKVFVRRAKQTSFILPNHHSFRIVHNPLHRAFLAHFHALYSTSANRTTQAFSLDFALDAADIVALDERGIYDAPASTIYKLSCTNKRKIR